MRPEPASASPITERVADPRLWRAEGDAKASNGLAVESKGEASEFMYRIAFERSAVGLAILEAQGGWVVFNQVLCEIFGETDAWLRATSLLDLIRPEDRPALRTDLNLETGPTKVVECRFRHRRKSWIWGRLNLSATTVEEGVSPVWICQFEDVTERHLEQVEAAQERHLLAETIARAPIAIALFDTSMCYLAHSARWLEDHDTTGESVVGRSHYEVNPDIPERWREVHRRYLAGEVIGADEDTFKRDDGRVHHYRWAAHPWKTADGRIGGIIVVVTRINDLVHAREAALEASRLKSQFLANMSHELRTPMNGVLGVVELLLDTPLSLDQRDLASTIRESGRLLLTLINDILDFSRIEAGKLFVEPRVFNLRALVDEIAGIMALSAQLKGVELLCDFPLDLAEWYEGDSARIRRIVLNLIGNAIKFTEVGEVRIIAGVSPSVDSKDLAENQVLIRLSIHDTGVGIPENRRRSIFDSFTQGDGGPSRLHGGTGLGLSICQSMAQLLGGSIGLASEPGRGSTFHLDVPLLKREEAQPPSGPDGNRLPFQGETFLVADGNTSARALIRSQLEAWGGNVIEVDDADDALILLRSILSADRSAVLLVDERLAEAKPSFARGLVEEPSLTATPMILMTSGLTKPRALTLMSSAIAKPIRPACLLDLVTEAIRSRPKPSAPILRSTTPATPAAPKLAGIRVLLAEDNTTNQKVALNMLKRLGCEAEVALDGFEVLAKLDQFDFDLVLMDVQMPAMDGYRATDAIRRREVEQRGMPAKRLPIIAMTAQAMQGDRERCLAAQMDDYLSKPATISELAQTIERWVVRPETEPKPIVPVETLDGPTEPPALRVARLHELSQGDAKFERELLGILLGDVDQEMNRLKSTLDPLDLPLVRAALHGIVGACRTVGADALAMVCRTLENQTQGPGFQPDAAWLDPIDRERERLVAAIDAYLHR